MVSESTSQHFKILLVIKYTISLDLKTIGDVLDVSMMKVADLKKQLKSLSLPTSGNKSELTDRLQLALTQHDKLNEEELLAQEPVTLTPSKKVLITN